MEFINLTSDNKMWNEVILFAEKCSWKAGKTLSKEMEQQQLSDWERVIIALDDGEMAGYCTVAKTDCIPNVEYTPYIGFMFVDEKYRGKKLSQKLVKYAMMYLKTLGFDKVYLVSDHMNLYEKYGFTVIDRKIAPWGSEEKIYMQRL